MIALDTETHLFGPGKIAPKVVCASFSDGQDSFVLGNGDPELVPFLEQTLREERVGGQRIQYDLACIRETWPALTSTIFQALAEGRVHDAILREKLINLGTHGDLENLHGKRLSYDLASLAFRRLGVDISASKKGEDIWRLRFAELDGLKAWDYPREAHDYAQTDAAVTHEVLAHQGQHPDAERLLAVETFHVRAAFCLYLISQRGLKVDPEKKAELEAVIDAELDPAKTPLLYKPLPDLKATRWTPKGKRVIRCDECGNFAEAHRDGWCQVPLIEGGKVNKNLALQPLIEQVCKAEGIDVPLTDPSEKFPQGQISASAETIEEIAHLHPALEQYAYRQERIKLKTDYFPSLEWPRGSGVVADVVHPNFDPLKKTGRVSSSGNRKGKEAAYPAIHVQAADPRIRDVFVPREGFVFAVADFNAIDLCSLAQTIKDLFGQSTHLDQINAGYELHALLGAVLAADDDARFRDLIAPFRDDDRKVYDAFQSTKGWKCGCGPDAKDEGSWFKHWRGYAKVFGLTCPGGGGLKTLVKIAADYGFKITKEEARAKRNRWFQVYPEMRRYLQGWVEEQKVPGTDKRTYVSPLGMVRAGCSYTECANGRALQTPAAEGMKEAMWRVTRACYDPALGDVLFGSYPVVNMHDELVLEVPEDGLEAERAERMSRLMVEGMRMVLPDVDVKAEPLLSRRWTKKAKAVRGADGRLKVWEA